MWGWAKRSGRNVQGCGQKGCSYGHEARQGGCCEGKGHGNNIQGQGRGGTGSKGKVKKQGWAVPGGEAKGGARQSTGRSGWLSWCRSEWAADQGSHEEKASPKAAGE